MAQPTISRMRRAAVAVKIETTYGTDPTLAAADIIMARNVAFRVQQEQFRDDRQGGLVAEFPDVPGARWAQLSFEAVVRGAGAAYSASVKPEIDALLRACGYAATGSFVATLEKYDYQIRQADPMGESVTAALFPENAPQGKLLGAFGTGRLIKRAGEPLVFAVVLSGLYVVPADVTLLTAAPPTVVPPTFKSGALTVGGTLHRVASVEVDFGNEVQAIMSGNDAQAVAGFLLSDHRPTFTMDPEAVAVSTYNWHGKRDTPGNSGVGDAGTWQVGTTQYNRIKFDAPRMQVSQIAEAQRNGFRVYQISGKLNSDASYELKITFD